MARRNRRQSSTFWWRFENRLVVLEYRGWTGVVRFVQMHRDECGRPWCELRTLDGHTAFVDGGMIDVIVNPRLGDP